MSELSKVPCSQSDDAKLGYPGAMTHNYYLYGDPDDNGRLLWIPWDLNECRSQCEVARQAQVDSQEEDHLDEVGNDWPVIRHLDDPSIRPSITKSLNNSSMVRLQSTHFMRVSMSSMR